MVESANASGVLFVLGLGTSAIAFILLVWGINALLSPRNPSTEKGQPYECGMDAAGHPWANVNLRFSTVALLFVLFAVTGSGTITLLLPAVTLGVGGVIAHPGDRDPQRLSMRLIVSGAAAILVVIGASATLFTGVRLL